MGSLMYSMGRESAMSFPLADLYWRGAMIDFSPLLPSRVWCCWEQPGSLVFLHFDLSDSARFSDQ
jgi:hypothetical protein